VKFNDIPSAGRQGGRVIWQRILRLLGFERRRRKRVMFLLALSLFALLFFAPGNDSDSFTSASNVPSEV
jgi:hypothetical protein